LWELPDAKTLKGKRDRAILSLLLACGLRRGEVAALELDDIQRCEDHWAIVDLTGKGGHVRTVPVPDWVTDDSRVGHRGRHKERQTISMCLSGWKDLGRFHD
jgi:site-specific recombinase XerD